MHELDYGQALRHYVVREILEGNDDGFNGQTPLLEWGLLNSMEMVRMLAFIRATFGVEIAPDQVTPAHFRTVDTIVELLKQQTAPGRQS